MQFLIRLFVIVVVSMTTLMVDVEGTTSSRKQCLEKSDLVKRKKIVGCVSRCSGDIKIISPNEVCFGERIRLTWNRMGPQGPKGEQGPVGPPGPKGEQGEAGGGGGSGLEVGTTIGATINAPPINVQSPFLTVNYIMATQGVFPSAGRRNLLEEDKGSTTNAHRSLQSANPFLGQIILSATPIVPRGWVACNGQLLPVVAQNQALFSLLGVAYGGDGRTTFAVPDLRGRAPIHLGQGSGLSNRNRGEDGGSETATISNAQITIDSVTPPGTTS